jgi:ABC-2 type transport system ATP-binding protein
VSEPAIVVQGLAKTYRVAKKSGEGVRGAIRALFHREYESVKAVDDISFTIEPGSMVAFLGPNGAGKTTTLKMLSGLIYPTAGSASVLGFTPWDRADAYRRRFALVMGQKNQLWWDLPARESFRLHREIYDLAPDRFNRIRDELVELLSLTKLVDRPVRELSLGERMKMELVAALLHEPQVLFLDEPTIGLDVVAQGQLREFLRRYNREREITVILTSHYMKDVESLCSRAIVINHGRIVFDGGVDEIRSGFSAHKIVRLTFADAVPPDLSGFGAVVEAKGPLVELRVPRADLGETLAKALARFSLDDISVTDVPLEEAIASLFTSPADADTMVTADAAASGGRP